MSKTKFIYPFKQLYFQVFISIIIGALLGYFYPAIGSEMKVLGDVFIKLIRMMIPPIIFTTVVIGIATMKDVKEVGRIGIKALIYFEVVTTLALIIGLLVANIHQPGAGLNIDVTKLDGRSISAYATKADAFSAQDFLMNIIPETLLNAFTKGDILPVLFVSVLFGFALLHVGNKAKPIIVLCEQFSSVFFSMLGFVMKVAPLGAFGAMAYTIGAHGIHTLLALGRLLLDVYFTSFVFVFLVLGVIAWFCKFNLWHFLKYIKEELLIVLGTSSSETVLPRLMDKLEKLGCSKPVVGLVIPAGYSFNFDGTCIYLTLAALFIAQALNIPLTLLQQLTLLGVLLLTSKGAAGVSGGGFIVLAATLASMQTIPVEGMVLLLGVDRFMSQARALTNLIGNGVATIVIAKWEGDFDLTKYRKAIKEGPQEVEMALPGGVYEK